MTPEEIIEKARQLLKALEDGEMKPESKDGVYIIDLSSFIGETFEALTQKEVIEASKERLTKLVKIQEDRVANNRITVLKEKISNVYQWSSKLTAEARDWDYFNEIYHWPDEVKRLLVKIRLARGALIGVMGNQGIGKSSAMQAIWSNLSNSKICPEVKGKKVIALKWPESGNLIEAIQEAFPDDFEEEYEQAIVEKAETLAISNNIFRSKLRKMEGLYIDSVGIWKFINKLLSGRGEKESDVTPSLDFLETLLPKPVYKELREKAIIQMLYRTHSVMIDLPDYSRSDKRMMARDLDEIQSLWNKSLTFDSIYGGKVADVNFVIFIQKELLHGSHGLSHYLFGKMDIVEIKPLTPQQLVNVYLKKFKDHYPFTPDALTRLARLSRGIFRRFLRYISLCLEEWMALEDMARLIDLPLTEKAITNEEVGKDMDLELSGLFPKSEDMKRKAIKTITYLMNTKEGLNQKQLAKALNLNEMDASRLCDKLEEHGYIVRETSKEGKIVRANI